MDAENQEQYKAEFENLWSLYPKKLGKKKAFDNYIKARESGESFEKIKFGLEMYLHYLELNHIQEQFIKHGSSWFSRNSWNDEHKIYMTITENKNPKKNKGRNLEEIYFEKVDQLREKKSYIQALNKRYEYSFHEGDSLLSDLILDEISRIKQVIALMNEDLGRLRENFTESELTIMKLKYKGKKQTEALIKQMSNKMQR